MAFSKYQFGNWRSLPFFIIVFDPTLTLVYHCCRLELPHGTELVTHTLAFITLSNIGITESELEDALSLSDPVLNEVSLLYKREQPT